MVFGQLSNRESLRDFVLATQAHASKTFHLGFGKYATRSNLSKENAFYIFDRGYNDFKRLHNIESVGAYFVVRGKKANDFKPMKWTRRFPAGSGILSDCVGYMNGQQTREKNPDKIHRIIYWDQEETESSFSSLTHWISAQCKSPSYITRGGISSCSSSG